MKLIEKIAAAKKEIKESKLKKEGRNEFSKYDYFTPSQIEFLVQQVCQSQKMLTKFDLIRNDLGVYGVLTIFDCESTERMEYQMATAIPEIKATNISQQLGGCMTYTERYLKTSAFGITDNNLDFDSQKPEEKTKPTETPNKLQENTSEFLDWVNSINNCSTVGELNVLYNNSSKFIESHQNIKVLFTKRKETLQSQAAQAK